MASTRIYCPDGHLGFRMAWMAAWLSVKMVHLPGVTIVVYILLNWQRFCEVVIELYYQEVWLVLDNIYM